MFFVLSKTLFYILMPLIWIVLILLYAFFTKNAKIKNRLILLGLFLVFFFGNDFIINELFQIWERKPVPISSLKNYETGIVLTGITNTEKVSGDRVYFQKGADRLLHTVQLYKLGKIKNILITGGSGLVIGRQTAAEADQLKSVFLYCGIPEKDIMIENQSRNTRENALFTRRTIDSLRLQGEFLMVTSAFHMRRAEGCFKKVGLAVDVFPVDYYSKERKFTPNILLIPSEGAMGKWATLIHEVTGYLVYKMLGYC